MLHMKMRKTYEDFLIFEKQAITNLNWTLDEVEQQDYYLLMEILGMDDEQVANDEVIDDPRELLNLM
ncbi:hypothetical protein A3O16_02395 [Ligilactobacillus aviarius]|uniref:Uncharacterized protein n=2 Tax=Ligilactobacillus aviarius TaxID=1606 RepID=A0A179C3G3_9LACO|nr:hypothetical protein A3O09_06355 [Ligilactobacillus aviarius]OAP99712.1 hypothetical protein A3O08_04610 [Ligilactobacillus aviarius]OAQ00168.1 hypothetical protein A3O07_00155 [Ligilactobacillus aviarius]OAQ03538.1 hypothetical protein A3O13_06435 [Ligilactobacillus aviarius]OAQ09069.1 hypothetical protein A3O14_01910 [Ligilactobacillus aviarius]